MILVSLKVLAFLSVYSFLQYTQVEPASFYMLAGVLLAQFWDVIEEK